MRILHLLNHTRRMNGHVHAAVDLACAQVQLGHEVCVASEGGDFDELLSSYGVESLRIAHQRRPDILLRSLRKLHRTVRAWRPDVIHAHMMTSAVLARPICWLAGIPLVTTVHNEFEKSAILMGLGERVIAVSAAVGRSMQRRGVPERRLRVVLNGTIGAARYVGKERAPRALRHPALIFVGGLHPRKGLPDLFAAFDGVHARFPEARLYVVGDGPYRGAYEALAQRAHAAQAITFFGAQDDPFPFLLAADIFVLPAHADPAPLVLSEAREAGCAIVATEVDGIPQMLEGGEAGLLAPPRDPQALSAAICGLLQSPDALRAWRERSQRNIQNMRIERVARETLSVYADAMPRRRVAPTSAARGRA